MTDSNDPNPKGTVWWQTEIYGKVSDSSPIFPEEDYQVAALPKTILHREIGRRLGVVDEKIVWKGRHVDMSAVSDKLLLHHVLKKLEC